MIRILIADDPAVVRDGLRLLLETVGGIAVIGEAGNGAKVVQLVDELQHDLVLMDLRMPGMDGAPGARARLKIDNDRFY